MQPIRKILVPVDFSTHAMDALEHALLLGDALGATVDVLHVGMPPTAYAPLDRAIWGGKPHADLERLARAATSDEFDAFLGQLSDAQRKRFGRRLEWGTPYQQITKLAEDDGYDLVIVGTHGRTGAKHVLLGSVAERVVRHAPCPVLAVR